ncbi:MAG TPA: phosphoglycerate mutase family protein [Candidatus Dormibacteraeota bacterium]|nr:phosphoglycerate mutase family protein [Candidatus Dormibacteraeota bacterium]
MSVFYFVRHAKAGSRGHWQGDDRLRPLSKKGIKQAEALVDVFKPFKISAIYSSPYLRCVQTVEPLARDRGLEVQQTLALQEGRGLRSAYEFVGDPKLDDAVLSTHGDVVWELVEDLVQRRVIKPGEGGYEKGSTWVVEVQDGEPVRARFIPAP